MNITVYCGAHCGRDPAFAEAARALGVWIAGRGFRLVYGAGDVGMMGVLANAVLEGGGEVLGVTPDFFIPAEEIHESLTELRVTENLPDRRKIMIDEGDAFIALPGGTGTLDEITEVMSLMRLDMLRGRDGIRRPVILYNVNGYYDHFFRFLDRMADEEYFGAEDRRSVYEINLPDEIDKILEQAGYHIEESV